MKMGDIIGWIWLIFTVIVLGKAYYDTAKDILAWIKKKIHKAKEKKNNVESAV